MSEADNVQKLKKPHIIGLGVSELDPATGFYSELFGWKVSAASNEMITFFDTGNIIVSLFPREALAADAAVSSAGSGFSGITLAHNVPSKEEVALVLTKAESLGAKITRPAQDADWGGYRGYFSDLDGHLWEIAWNPYFTFRNDGTLDPGI